MFKTLVLIVWLCFMHPSSAILKWPTNSAMGIIVAIAVPLKIPGRNVFVSYNFEANYNLPALTTDITQGPLKRLDLIPPASRSQGGSPSSDKRGSDASKLSSNETITNPIFVKHIPENLIEKPLKKFNIANLLTRKKAYGILINKLNAEGYDGKKCLLRSICEASDVTLEKHNGVLGSVFHIILTPSTSKDENLPPEFERAENLGRKHNCKKYNEYCESSVLDMITTIIKS